MKWMGVVGQVIFWGYRRGSWQYDVLCALILAFIFLTPADVFNRRLFSQAKEPEKIEKPARDSDKTQASSSLKTYPDVSLQRESKSAR
tara:strand:- start:250 stop:513 length:264 start_codon:yes stop_codon:yes gene_type:complete